MTGPLRQLSEATTVQLEGSRGFHSADSEATYGPPLNSLKAHALWVSLNRSLGHSGCSVSPPLNRLKALGFHLADHLATQAAQEATTEQLEGSWGFTQQATTEQLEGSLGFTQQIT